MGYNPKIHRRRSLRLKGYDYTQVGAYFVTIVTQGKLRLFGEIVGKEMRLNEAGEMVCGVWEVLPQRFPAIEMDMFVVMPNHLHGIVVIKNKATPTVQPAELTDVGAGLVPAQNTNATEHRATPTVQPAELTDVGAGLVPAQNTNATEHRATPTVQPAELTDVGAGLVPAQNTNAIEHRATTRVAPTGDWATTRVAPTGIMDGGVEAPTTDRFALGDVIGAYKSLTTVEYARGVKQMKWPPFHKRLWQRNYYEHVVRHDESLQHLQQYILDNPAQWAFDKENPLAKRPKTEKL